MKLFLIFLVPFLFLPAFAQLETDMTQTDKGTLNVEISKTPTEPKPGDVVKLQINFINPSTNNIQEHIDYRLTVSKDGLNTFGPIPLTHTSTGSVTIPVSFEREGKYLAEIEVEGILFQPIPKEIATFDIFIGTAAAQPNNPTPDNGGGCLIATATFDSEMSTQVQQLREVRDNVVLKTNSGIAFMSAFNQLYYSFSPTVADYERENPYFKESMKIALTPMLTSLSILNLVDIDSESEMVGYGIGIILANAALYVGLPVFGILKIYQFRRK